MRRSPEACVLPRKGNPKELPRFSWFQQEVSLEWGLHVPPETMDIVPNLRGEWEDDLVWEHLHVPKPQQVPECEETWASFEDIRKEWRLGRSI